MARKKGVHDDLLVPADSFSRASRREFLKTAIAVSAMPIVAGATAGTATAAVSPQALPLYKVIFDEQFSECRAFARKVRTFGLPVQGITADVTALWFNDLHGRWQVNPIAIAGLTAPAALFCLERLAWEHGMRVIFHAEHRNLSKQVVQHAVFDGDALLRPEELDAARTNWTDRIAELIARYPPEHVSRGHVTAAGLSRNENDKSLTLTSWVIAPANNK